MFHTRKVDPQPKVQRAYDSVANLIGNMTEEETAQLAGMVMSNVSIDRNTCAAMLAQLSAEDQTELGEWCDDADLIEGDDGE